MVATPQNQLIARLPRKDRTDLLTRLKSVPLTMHEVLCQGGQPLRHVYFPIEGIISQVTLIDAKPAFEVGMVGREGMLGTQLSLGIMSEPSHIVVQGSGTAWQMESRAFRRALSHSPALMSAMHRYLHVTTVQLATSAGCLRFHQISQRLARWLLMTQDRAHSDTFRVTHEFLSFMLGVRRVSITTAAAALQRQQLITYSRGKLTVLSRQGLQRAACSCYAADRKAYAALLP